MKLLSEIAQLGQLIQQLLQIPIRDLMLQTRNERFGFLGVIAAQTSCYLLAAADHFIHESPCDTFTILFPSKENPHRNK